MHLLSSMRRLSFLCLTALWLLPSVSSRAQESYWNLTNGPRGATVNALAIDTSRETVYLSATNSQIISGVYASSDRGSTWTSLQFNAYDLAVPMEGGLLTATWGEQGGVHYRDDEEWNRAQGIPVGTDVSKLEVGVGGRVFACTSQGVFRSTNDGLQWARVGAIPAGGKCAVSASRDTVIVTVSELGEDDIGHLYLSLDGGETWQEALSYGLKDERVVDLVAAWGDIFAVAYHGLFRCDFPGERCSRIDLRSQLNISNATFEPSIADISFGGNRRLYLSGIADGGLVMSENRGVSWKRSKLGQEGLLEVPRVAEVVATSDNVWTGLYAGSLLYVGGPPAPAEAIPNLFGGVYVDSNATNKWEIVTRSLIPTGVTDVTYGSTGAVYAGTDGGGVFRFTPEIDWTALEPDPLRGKKVTSLLAEDNVIAGMGTGEIHCQAPEATVWTSSRPAEEPVTALLANPQGERLAGFANGEIYRSAGGCGEAWMRDTSLAGGAVTAMLETQNITFAGTEEGIIYQRSSRAAKWSQTTGSLPEGITMSLAEISPDTILVGIKGEGVFRSGDGAKTWNRDGLVGEDVTSFLVKASDEVYAGTYGGGVFRRGERGWVAINRWLSDMRVLGLTADEDGTLYAATPNIVMRGLGWTKSDVDSSAPSTLDESVLHNYPDPFRKSTFVRFSVHTPGRVTITLYDLLGRHVTTVLDKQLRAGFHEVRVASKQLPAGQYLFQITTPEHMRTERATLVR